MTSGGTGGGADLLSGMLRFTACSWIGIVMISITSSTSMTSISGVVLMSIMTSGSPDPPPVPTFIAIACSFRRACATRRRLGDEAHFRDSGALRGVDHAADALVVRAAVAADLNLRLRIEHRDLL